MKNQKPINKYIFQSLWWKFPKNLTSQTLSFYRDMTYFKETVDEEEIRNYLKMLSSTMKNQNQSKEKNSDENQIEYII